MQFRSPEVDTECAGRSTDGGERAAVDGGRRPELVTQRERASLVAARGCSSMVERQLPKLRTRVRFPSSAPPCWRRSAAAFCGLSPRRSLIWFWCAPSVCAQPVALPCGVPRCRSAGSLGPSAIRSIDAGARRGSRRMTFGTTTLRSRVRLRRPHGDASARCSGVRDADPDPAVVLSDLVAPALGPCTAGGPAVRPPPVQIGARDPPRPPRPGAAARHRSGSVGRGDTGSRTPAGPSSGPSFPAALGHREHRHRRPQRHTVAGLGLRPARRRRAGVVDARSAHPARCRSPIRRNGTLSARQRDARPGRPGRRR